MGTRVYIGGLPHPVEERDIDSLFRDVESFFRFYGELRMVSIKNGYGFVEFYDYRHAADAVYYLNGKELCGARVTVQPAKGSPRARGRGPPAGPSPRNGGDYGCNGFRSPRQSGRGDNPRPSRGPPIRTDYRLLVKNLPSRIGWKYLKGYMGHAGEVTYAGKRSQYANEGVVEFATYADMKNAIDKLDNSVLDGCRIRLIEDMGARRGSHHRSRSPSRSRSRSRSRRRPRSRSPTRGESSVTKCERDRSKSPDKSNERHEWSVTKGERDRPQSPDKSNERHRSKSRDKSAEPSKGPAHNGHRETNPRRDDRYVDMENGDCSSPDLDSSDESEHESGHESDYF